MPFDTISIVGLGYIGLPTAAVFAGRKKRVIGVDVNQAVVDTINRGGIHIVEPDLDMVVHAAVVGGYLRATVTPEPADAFLIAVPTPFKEDNQPDLSFIENACRAIAPVLRKGNLVILESTSPVGATEKMSEWLAAARPDLTFPQTHGDLADIRIAYCPERVLPGHVLRELVQNDRIIGGMSAACSRAACELYGIFVEGDCVVTGVRTAEMCKLTENSFRDVNIAFANELSLVCDKLGINVWELIRLANRHPRVNILQPGPGVGGHCIAVDPWFIVSAAPEEAKLISTARRVNDGKPEWVLNKVRQTVAGLGEGLTRSDVTVACYGVTFKPDIDDVRESPAMKIVQALAGEGIRVVVVDPHVAQLPQLENVPLVSFEEAGRLAQVALILVGHKAFREKSRESWAGKTVIDACGLLA